MDWAVEIPASPVTVTLTRLADHFTGRLAEVMDEWSAAVSRLSEWEVAHLLDEPEPAVRQWHRQAVESLLKVGRWFLHAVELPEWPDAARREMVRATLTCLEDKWRLWHQPPLAPERARQILNDVFGR